jgi:3',5'-nucleoside bisphosphate phosphatase
VKVDLHVHSTASDGRHSPEEVVRMAAQLGLAAISITDHDSVDGVAPALRAARNHPGLQVIPGVECSTDVPHGEVHVLGYFIDAANPELVIRLAAFRNSRKVRAQKMIAKLATMGVQIEWKRVEEIAGAGSVGRPHIAQAMHEKGCVPSVKEAFNRYIGREGPAYVEREKMTPDEVVELLTRVGGLAVLAHPADIEDLDHLLPRLQRLGLAGIEAYYKDYPPHTTAYLASLAHKHGLIATGGSDYHGIDNLNETPLGGVAIPSECVDRLRALHQKRNPRA